MTLLLKRVYEAQSPEDGFRILVDRLWPRGITKEKAAVDLWLKEAAPSPELRKTFCHDPEKWDDFRARYVAELETNAAVDTIMERLREGTVTLVYAAKDETYNHAAALAEHLERQIAVRNGA
jgi:uncharacterized protein YeaO (DUF488 family)